MPSIEVETRSRVYPAIVTRGILRRLGDYIAPATSKVFVLTTHDVWRHHRDALEVGLDGSPYHLLLFDGGEERKRLAQVEALAEKMVAEGADRSSLLVAFGGGIVGDVGGFLAAIFMRGIGVLQVPTTLLAQVDAAIGGKTGVNLTAGKNLLGAFYQPLAALIDPDVLATLPEREYRSGLYEVIKCGIIRSRRLFRLLVDESGKVLAHAPEVVEQMIAECVRIKADVVAADERESDLRRILNFGHTLGHALEAETGYSRFLHGEAVAFGMRAATHLAHLTGALSAEDGVEICDLLDRYGPIPSLKGISAERLVGRLKSDKKTRQGMVHFVLPEKIGQVRIVSGLSEKTVRIATESALAGLGCR